MPGGGGGGASFCTKFFSTHGPRQNLSRIETVRVYLEQDIIKEVNHKKWLGVIIDRNFTWNK